MTEEIIIDGVNVAGCRHFKDDGIKKPICRSGGCGAVYRSCLCEDNADCDYKQLKRLEQENKKLKYLISEEQCFEEGCKKCTKAYYTDDTYRSALEEIRGLVSPHCTQYSQIINIINEVLQ